jgi:hypothetical protein
MPSELVEENPFDIRLLEPSRVRLFRVHSEDATVRMTLGEERSWIEVRIARALPFSDPDRYIGLRDGADKDIGIIEDPRQLNPESQAIVNAELELRYFTPTVLRVLSVKEEMGSVTWMVETDRGERRILVRNLRDNSFPLGPTRLMITDTDGNRFEFPDITAYGPKAFAVLAKVI